MTTKTTSENRDDGGNERSKKRRIIIEGQTRGVVLSKNNQKQNEKTIHPHQQQQQQQQQQQKIMNPTTTNIDFIEQSFLTIDDPLMMKFKPNREEIERALKRTTSSFLTNNNKNNNKTIIDDEEDITNTNINNNNHNNTEDEDDDDVITRAVDILRAQMTIKMEAEEMAKAMEMSLRENEENENERKREEEEARRRDPVKAYASASAMGEKALRRMFLGEGGTNSSKAMELCEFEKKWYKSARETIEDVFEQIGSSVENAKTEEEVGQILRNSLELLFEQTLQMPMKAGAIPEIFASEDALEGKNVAAGDVVEVGSSSEEDEEGQEE